MLLLYWKTELMAYFYQTLVTKSWCHATNGLESIYLVSYWQSWA